MRYPNPPCGATVPRLSLPVLSASLLAGVWLCLVYVVAIGTGVVAWHQRAAGVQWRGPHSAPRLQEHAPLRHAPLCSRQAAVSGELVISQANLSQISVHTECAVFCWTILSTILTVVDLCIPGGAAPRYHRQVPAARHARWRCLAGG
jgi:hypothetical protein